MKWTLPHAQRGGRARLKSVFISRAQSSEIQKATIFWPIAHTRAILVLDFRSDSTKSGRQRIKNKGQNRMRTRTTRVAMVIVATLWASGCTEQADLEEAKQWYQPWFSEAEERVEMTLDSAFNGTELDLSTVAGGAVEEDPAPAQLQNPALSYDVPETGPDARIVTIKIKRGETLGLYSKWSSIPIDELRALNEMKRGSFNAGKPFRLLLDSEGWRSFEAKRSEHFTTQEKMFFTQNEVTELQRYTIRKNDTISKISKAHNNVPVWLLQKFNASFNLARLRVGDELLVPSLDQVGQNEAAEQLWASNKPTAGEKLPSARQAVGDVTRKPAPIAAAPKSTRSIPENPTGLDVKVVRNETVGHYSQWSGLSIQAIKNANSSLNPDRIQLGQTIHLPMRDTIISEFYQARRKFHGTPTAAAAPSKTADAEPTTPVATPTPKTPTPIQTHRVASGETAWAIATKRYKITLSRLQRANPNKNLDRLREGDVLKIPALAQTPGGSSVIPAP